jgi:hypothetical protein
MTSICHNVPFNFHLTYYIFSYDKRIKSFWLTADTTPYQYSTHIPSTWTNRIKKWNLKAKTDGASFTEEVGLG